MKSKFKFLAKVMLTVTLLVFYTLIPTISTLSAEKSNSQNNNGEETHQSIDGKAVKEVQIQQEPNNPDVEQKNMEDTENKSSKSKTVCTF